MTFPDENIEWRILKVKRSLSWLGSTQYNALQASARLNGSIERSHVLVLCKERSDWNRQPLPDHVRTCHRVGSKLKESSSPLLSEPSEMSVQRWCHHHHHHHLSLNYKGRWGTKGDFTTSFLHFSLFSTALWDLANPRPVHSLTLSSHLFLHLPWY